MVRRMLKFKRWRSPFNAITAWLLLCVLHITKYYPQVYDYLSSDPAFLIRKEIGSKNLTEEKQI
jgi:hypothetical protein